MKRITTLLLLAQTALFARYDFDALSEDLCIAKYWDEREYEWYPLTYTHIFEAGYYVTPSARMAKPGDLGGGIAAAPPYRNWIARVQPYANLAFSYAYRIFMGMPDSTLNAGFGDVADRGANFKINLMTPEQSGYSLPGVAFGIEDFIGSQTFRNYFVVGTYVFPTFGIETSFGWGGGVYTDGPSNGWFGGFSWYPFWRSSCWWYKGLGVAAEYDPTNYSEDPHHDARVQHSTINFGVEYQVGEILYLSGSYIRGNQFAGSANLHLNIESLRDIIPKTQDPPPYKAPVDHEPLGCYRAESVMIQDMVFVLNRQGFDVHRAFIQRQCEEQNLVITLRNCCYMHEHVVRKRVQSVLAGLTPANIDNVVVILESYELPCQEYRYPRGWLEDYRLDCVHPFEMEVLAPRKDFHRRCNMTQIYNCPSARFQWALFPTYNSFLGGASGKFKYAVRLSASASGFWWGVYYAIQTSWSAAANIDSVSDRLLVHPSSLNNVATDLINYEKQGIVNFDYLYAQKNWNFGRGHFGKAALGYFQLNYAGVAGEWLYYPADSCLAIGIEGAALRKRSYTGLSFQDQLRRWGGPQADIEQWSNYFLLPQYFVNLYWNVSALQFDLKVSAGQFLAYDKGAYVEGVRYFNNGLRLGGWMTFTNAEDLVHGVNYYNRGVLLEVPLDVFFQKSCRKTYSRNVAAWLRDAGYWSSTGVPLFETINKERRW
ncbi:MAG: hypothetical protein S4CHLAM81_00570 [Chlamydiales bacterium]|nr:hypothetical protein [Chlamydiales bacterium]MCH9634859.1 hypothetical protein [Chlamydiales bacterium]MCH9703696.1 YjbH domain-containing protein [Chlamydiota bacterium]